MESRGAQLYCRLTSGDHMTNRKVALGSNRCPAHLPYRSCYRYDARVQRNSRVVKHSLSPQTAESFKLDETNISRSMLSLAADVVLNRSERFN